MSRSRIRALLLLAFPGFMIGPAASGQDAVELKVVRISDHAIIVRHKVPQFTNMIALDTQDGIVVIDAGSSAAVAAAARERIQEEFGKDRFAYLINTHDHGDHTYGNQAFADVTIVGHQDVQAQMEAGEERRHQTRQQLEGAVAGLTQRLAGMEPGSDQAEGLEKTITYYRTLAEGLGEGFRLTPPTRTFTDEMTLDLGDRTLELSYFGKAHSDTDILIFCPEEGLLATGDLFSPGNDLYIDSERVPFIPRWLGNLDWVLSEGTEVNTVLPAHEDPLPLEELTRVRESVRERKAALDGKESAFFDFRDVYEQDGVDAALQRMDELKAQPDAFFFFHAEFDSFVYRLMLDEDLEQAIPLFEKLAILFPEVPNAFDSLGEAYMRADRLDEAVSAFQKCLELDPEHQNAQRRLAEIGR